MGGPIVTCVPGYSVYSSSERFCGIRHQRSVKRILGCEPDRRNLLGFEPALEFFDRMDES